MSNLQIPVTIYFFFFFNDHVFLNILEFCFSENKVYESLLRCKMVFVTLLALVINDGLVQVYRIVICSECFSVYRE